MTDTGIIRKMGIAVIAVTLLTLAAALAGKDFALALMAAAVIVSQLTIRKLTRALDAERRA